MKNVCVATHMEIAGAAVLNAICLAGLRRRHEGMNPPAAIASAAGPGPKSSAAVKRNVSSIAMLADTDAKFNRNEPVSIASAASASQPSGCGVRAAVIADTTSTSAPAVTTTVRYARSARGDELAGVIIEPCW